MKKESVMVRVVKALREMVSRGKEIRALEDRVTVAESKPRRKKRPPVHAEPVGAQ